MPYLLHEDPTELLIPANHPRTKCEKTQILDEDVPYSIVVENIAAEGTRDMFNAFCFAMLIMCFLHIYLCKEAAVQRCSVKKVLLQISQYSQENTCARVTFSIK